MSAPVVSPFAPPAGFRLPLPRPGWAVAGPLVAVAFALLNALYVGCLSPHDLAPDEAHYWDWSRNLDWGYYSKGPLLAWLIRGGCALFGETTFGVRSVAVACGGLVLLALWRVAKAVLKCDRTAAGVVLAVASLPGTAAVGTLATIDGPYLACWAWAMAAGLHRRWKLAGLLVAVGTLAKPTMLLFPACVLLLVLVRPEWRRGVFWFFPLSLLGLVPLVAWNAAHEWVSVRHLFGHASNGGDPAAWYAPLLFVGGQFALLLGGWFVLWVVAVWKLRRDAEVAFVWWLSVPVFAAFLLATAKTAGEPNWPASAYLGGAVLVACVWPTDRRRWAFALFITAGVFASALVRFPALIRPVLAATLPAPTDSAPTPVRKLDPTARLAGWRTLAKAVDDIRAEEGEAEIATMAWTVPGELGFYCRGNPRVYSFGAAVGDRFSQLDVWRPNPVADAQEFAGRTFVYVGEVLPTGVFDTFEHKRRVVHSENGVPLAAWDVWVGRGYRGFDPNSPARSGKY